MKVKGLNDAKYTAITVYFTTIAILLSVITTFVLSKYINAYAIIYGICTWATPTIVLGVLFIPKVQRILVQRLMVYNVYYPDIFDVYTAYYMPP